GSGGSRDPLKGVDVAGLEEISIAESDWQNVFRLLKDIGLFDSDGTPSSTGPPPPTPGISAPSGRSSPPLGSAAPSTTGASASASASRLSSPPPTSPTPGNAQQQQHDPAIMAYLTRLLAFPEADAAAALSNTSGTDLAEALDYLCLHTDEAGLKR
ncbi:unnamed protein product, partial [Scytosiphon promiscuus]